MAVDKKDVKDAIDAGKLGLGVADKVADIADKVGVPGTGYVKDGLEYAKKGLDFLEGLLFPDSNLSNRVPVRLRIDSFSVKERQIHTFSMKFDQPTDMDGQVTGIVRGGKITMRMKALNSGNTDLVNWMCDSDQAHNGKIIFLNTTNGVKMKTLEFKDAFCVGYEEYWEDDIFNPIIAHWEEITISCRQITVAPMEFKNEWNLVE